MPAGTVVVVRDGDEGIETLMLHRSTAGAFGGMWVFPGGKVDPEDVDPSGPADELAVARRTAAREAREEAGLVLEAEDLVPLSHWMPPAIRPVRFSTWFFLARATDAVVAVDGHEISDHEWLSPAEVLSRRETGSMTLAPPTWVTLHTLSRHGAVADLLDAYRSGRPEHFVTEPRTVEGGTVALWLGDAAYGGGDLALAGARHRLWMVEGGWRYEREP